MTCQTAQSILLDPRDPSIDRSTLMAAASHAFSCDTCRCFAQELHRIEASLVVPGDESIELPAGGYDAFATRLERAASTQSRTRWRFVATAAVVALIGGACFLAGQQFRSQPVRTVTIPRSDTAAVFSPMEVLHSSKAFAEVAEVFDHRTTWVWTGDHAADVGVGQSPVDPAEPLLLLKLVLRSNQQILSSGDLAIVSGHSARLSLPLEDGKQIRYLVNSRTDQPDRIDITAELLGEDGAATPLAALSTRLHTRPGQLLRAGEMATTAGDYEVIANFARAVPEGAK